MIHTHVKHRREATLCTMILLAGLLGTGSTLLGQDEVRDRIVDERAIPDGHVLVEGDILLPDGQTRATYVISLWPGGIVPYQFDSSASQTLVNTMLSAMAEWEGVANIEFRPRQAEDDNFIDVASVSGTVSWSEGVGMAGGQHDIRMSCATCWGTMVHELGHALGFWHEQSRADRGTACGGACIQVNDGTNGTSNNISTGNAVQFAIRRSQGAGEYGPYDFDSIMHYGQCVFSCCSSNPQQCCRDLFCNTCAANPAACATISVVNTNETWQGRIGQRSYISTWDELVMSFLYPKNDWRFLDDECGDRGWVCNFPDLGGCLLQFGTFGCPYVDDFPDAISQTPESGTLWILSNGTSYATGGSLSKAMTIRAPMGATLTK